MTKTLFITIGLAALGLALSGVPVMEYKEYFAASIIAAILVPKFLVN